MWSLFPFLLQLWLSCIGFGVCLGLVKYRWSFHQIHINPNLLWGWIYSFISGYTTAGNNFALSGTGRCQERGTITVSSSTDILAPCPALPCYIGKAAVQYPHLFFCICEDVRHVPFLYAIATAWYMNLSPSSISQGPTYAYMLSHCATCIQSCYS